MFLTVINMKQPLSLRQSSVWCKRLLLKAKQRRIIGFSSSCFIQQRVSLIHSIIYNITSKCRMLRTFVLYDFLKADGRNHIYCCLMPCLCLYQSSFVWVVVVSASPQPMTAALQHVDSSAFANENGGRVSVQYGQQ